MISDLSIGDYVLTGGEIPAMILIDSVSRQIQGVLGKHESLEEERVSTSEVYTRPEILKYNNKNYRVPKVLLSGNHGLIEKWKKNVVELDQLLYEDARKEFTLHAHTGFGVDGGLETRALDFEQVRGDFEKNTQVASIKEHIQKKTALGDELIHRMEKIAL